jgi:hypothetical protein
MNQHLLTLVGHIISLFILGEIDGYKRREREIRRDRCRD